MKIKKTIITSLVFLLSVMFCVTAVKAQSDQSLPSLQGDEAIEKLRETGQYDSLREAFNASRKENGQTDDENQQDAVGQTRKLLASDAASDDFFGWSVAISGDTAIVGAYNESTAPNSVNGAAYVFVRSGTTWTEQAKLLASDAASSDNFGYSVAISGDTAIVGANQESTAPNNGNGAAYIFVRSGTTWTQSAKLTDSNSPATSDFFGSSVGISGDKIIVGSPNSDDAASTPLTEGSLVPQATNQGAVFMFVNGFAPTAANVSISGRVFGGNGRGLANAVVYLTDSEGNTRATRSTSFGYYRFDDIEVGQTLLIAVKSKQFQYTPQVVSVADQIQDLHFYPQ